ncbi:MAG: MBL fold metallo-hydrolase [Pyrodictiaceae archaeon]
MVKRIKMVILDDNEPGPGLLNDWGWSIYIEADDTRLLFDADTSPRIIEYNARRLGIDLSKLDFAVLSHHHHDHYGGFEYVGRVSPGLRIYVPPGDTRHLHAMGLSPLIVEEDIEVSPGIWIIGPLEAGAWPLYEQALAVDVEELGLIVVVGCSHPGADALAERALKVTGRRIYWVIGGYHEPPLSVLENLARIASRLSPAHCSGDYAKNYVGTHMPDKYVAVKTGTIVEASSKGLWILRE